MQVNLGGYSRKSSRRIGLTPLADLVFILLVFFILETHFIDFRQLDLRLPDNKTEGESSAEYVELQLFTSGRIWLEGNTLSIGEVGTYFKNLNTDLETLVILKAEDAVPLQLLVSTVDQLEAASMNKVLVQRLEQ